MYSGASLILTSQFTVDGFFKNYLIFGLLSIIHSVQGDISTFQV